MPDRSIGFNARLINGDSRLLLELIPDHYGKIDAVITSPPYWQKKDYGVEGQVGFGQTKEDYCRDLVRVFEACWGLTKPQGSMWVVAGDGWLKGEQQLIPYHIAEAARKAGWTLRDTIVWDKSHNVPWHNGGRFRSTTEYIFIFSRTPNDFKFYVDRLKTTDATSRWWADFPERFNPRGTTPTNLWSIPLRTQGSWRKPSDVDHHCPFPVELVRRMVEVATNPGETILDPFAGTGMVLAVAGLMGRNSLGIELNSEFIAMYDKVVQREVRHEFAELKRNLSEATGIQDFEKLILKLRALKYGREVGRRLKDARGAGAVYGVIVEAKLPDQYVRGQSFDVKLAVVSEKLPSTAALEDVSQAMRRPPLSYYGIKGQLEVVNLEAALRSRRQLFASPLNIYPGKIRKVEARQSFKEFIREPGVKSRTIPVLSQITVDIDWVNTRP